MFDFYTDNRANFREICSFAPSLFLYVKGIPGHWSFKECFYDVDPMNVMTVFTSTDSTARTLVVISERNEGKISFFHRID